MEAVLRGIGDIVPIDIMKLFTWREVEMLACGLKTMDLDLLKRMVKVEEGVGEIELALLWQVLESFTEAERSLFLRFVWGRSRLPLREQDCKSRTIAPSRKDEDPNSIPNTIEMDGPSHTRS